MNERIRQQLLDYAVGALDDDEHAQIERRIAADPALQEELELVIDQLSPLIGVDEDIEPPPRLAERTSALVDAHADSERHDSSANPKHSDAGFGVDDAHVMRPAPIVLSQGRVGEFLVATGMFMAVALLFFPAISNSRHMARIAQCHNNLRQLGIAMSIYSDLSGGYFPAVPASGNRAFAGVYGPILRDSGHLINEQLLFCPSTSLISTGDQFAIPSLADIDGADPQQLVSLRRFAGGSYGYNIGVFERGVYRPARNVGRSHFAMMADAPAISLAGYLSLNHGGKGLNLLYEDGRVQYVVQPDADEYLDHPFRNHLGVVEPGVTKDDAVIAPGYAPPFSHLVHRLPGEK